MSIDREFYSGIQTLREAAQRDGSADALESLAADITTMVETEAKELQYLSVRRVFEACVADGVNAINDMDPNYRGMSRYREAADVVNTSLFAHTMGQIIYTQMLDAYKMPELIGDSLVTIQQTNFSGEKIPGVTEVGDEVEMVNEGQPYPRALVGETYIETPETIKRGLIVDVSKETIFFDRTNLVLKRASNVGRFIAINREKRILDVVLGISTIYKRNGAAAVATYGSDNTVGSNALIDWTDVDAAETKFSAITDPNTGEPIVVTANVMIVPPALRTSARRIQAATMTGRTNGENETRTNGNSLLNDYSIMSNQYVRQRSGSDSTWFYGNPKEAFVYSQNFPLTVKTNVENAHASFERDIVSQSKASERGSAGVLERLYMIKCTG
jgi:hypothetical protein